MGLNNNKISFATESLSQVLTEAEPMLRAHWEEIADYKDKIPFAPDYSQYYKLEEAGHLLVCTARDTETLIGYSVYFVHRGIHYSKNIVATNDIFYVAPEYRLKAFEGRTLLAIAFLDYCESKLKDRDVSVISMHIKVWKDWSNLAERQGYKRVEYIHQKYIGAENGL